MTKLDVNSLLFLGLISFSLSSKPDFPEWKWDGEL